MQTHHVPQELVDMVLDHLHEDKRTLKACTLVSPSWLDTSRHHLFYDLTVPVSEDTKSFDAFTDFLINTPLIATYIRDLRLRHGSTSLEPFAFFTAVPKSQTRIGPDHLACILANLPRLQALLLDSVCIGGSELHGRYQHYPTTTRSFRLDSLALTNVRIEQSDYVGKHLSDLFMLFSRVQELKLRNLSTSFFPFFPDPFRPFRVDGISLQPHRLHVDSLSLDLSITTREFVDIIHRSVDSQKLTSLSATCTQVDELPLVGQIIHDAASTLTHFEFNLRDSIIDDMPTRADWRDLHLNACSALNSVVLHFMLEGYPSSGSAHLSQSTWTHVLDLLSTIPSTTPLSSITFNIVFLGEDEDEQLGGLDWEGMREQLTRFKGLKKVVFWSFDARLADRRGRGRAIESWEMTMEIEEPGLRFGLQDGLTLPGYERVGVLDVVRPARFAPASFPVLRMADEVEVIQKKEDLSLGESKRRKVERELEAWKESGVLCFQ
ncbi:hypothetical protein EIP91_004355 [Steccherinum ochraceum]|uniref:F-box domain-containing protein n=1 Tax=Steccherinum ochraceum TaxID=92696 RepID=A0A4R0R8W3_9APHY|nr:hypothetical protein EIP91_004355 [Steccherinum ochraceum]